MKAYLVVDLSVHDVEGFTPYRENVPAVIGRHGGRFLVRGAQPKSVEGGWSPERMVIIEFPTRQNAEQFLADPDFRDLSKIRRRTTTSKLVLVDGPE
jgi:uncharacterized protein (DUF1330 family)